MDARTDGSGGLLDWAAARAAGRAAGFAAVGAAACGPSECAARLDAWLARGAHADMAWMAETAVVRKSPAVKWPWATTALVGAASYLTMPADRQTLSGIGRFIARYARGGDYHRELKRRLKAWGDAVERLAGRPVRRIALVDTSAVLERELAVRAGVGWLGKNACLIGAEGDSWRLIGVLLTDLPSPAPVERLAGRCGGCRRCLDACPTGALAEPWFVDARRCIAYWTTVHQGPTPRALQPAIGDWLFGCDVCQEVCPENRQAQPTDDPCFSLDPRCAALTLSGVLRLDEERFRRSFRGSPLGRAGRARILRNALVVALNLHDAAALAAGRDLLDDADPAVRRLVAEAPP